MSNWVTNVVTTVNGEDFDKLRELLIDNNGNVDFNIVAPIPKDLEITAGSYSYTALPTLFKEKICSDQTLVIDPKLKPFYNDKITQVDFVIQAIDSFTKEDLESFKQVYNISYDINTKDFIDAVSNIIKGYFNYNRYGYTDWYDANNALWGTKWNAHDSIEYGSRIEFATAWSCPIPLLCKISETIPIIVAFADEDIGSNCGLIELDNGNITDLVETDNIDKGMALVLLIKGYDVEEYFQDYTDDEIKEYFLSDTKEHMVERVLKEQKEINDILNNNVSIMF